jgi:glucosylceramidase
VRHTIRGVLVAALTATLLPLAAGEGAAEPAPRAGGSIDFRDELQAIDGFGFSQAFQRADWMRGARGLTPEHQREVLDLLLDRETGAGLSILRLGIGSSPDYSADHMRSIQPADPGGPDAEPVYEWDGHDGGQLWLAREARDYGVERFYADAWSAPGYMKTNGDDANGGRLCGLQGTDCGGEDWRRAYAEYLVQYARFYAAEGIEITDLGFTNEPDLNVSYASMEFTPEQAAEMAVVLGEAIEDSELSDMNLVCCDAAGWTRQRAYTEAIEADPEAAAHVDLHTGHPYVDPAREPLPTGRHTWMSEWSPNGTTWNEAWDDGSGYDGFTVAQDIHASIAEAGVNAYVYWFGASAGTTRGLIQLDGPDYRVSKRLWALAAYSRFIRPDAVRVAAASDAEGVQVTAFRNADGSRVLEILNTGTGDVRQSFDVGGARGAARGDVYLTDETHSLERTGTARLAAGRLAVTLPPRSLTTVVLP